MKSKPVRNLVAALVVGGGVSTAALVASASPASASYGPGTAYQVEISANTNSLADIGGNLHGSGGGLWFWAALTPSSPGSNTGSVDYEETDCVHGFPVAAPNGAVHNSGTTTYTDTGTELIITSVDTGVGPQTFIVPDTYGHYGAADVDLGFFNLLSGNIQAQVAP